MMDIHLIFRFTIIINIISDDNIPFLCTYETHNDDWSIIRKVSEQAFNILHSYFVRTSYLPKKNAANFSINEKSIKT